MKKRKTYTEKEMKLRKVRADMKQRTTNKNNCDWHKYGGRGIFMCQRWLDSCDNFVADMGPSWPGPGWTIERIDNDKGYSKENCKWILHAHQSRNTRATKLTEDMVREIRRLSYMSAKALAHIFNVRVHRIYAVRSGRDWVGV